MHFQKDLKDNKYNFLHLGQKYARIFFLGHNLFLIHVAHSSPRATLSEIRSFLGTDNVHGRISQHIFAQKMEAIAYIDMPTLINGLNFSVCTQVSNVETDLQAGLSLSFESLVALFSTLVANVLLCG